MYPKCTCTHHRPTSTPCTEAPAKPATGSRCDLMLYHQVQIWAVGGSPFCTTPSNSSPEAGLLPTLLQHS